VDGSRRWGVDGWGRGVNRRWRVDGCRRWSVHRRWRGVDRRRRVVDARWRGVDRRRRVVDARWRGVDRRRRRGGTGARPHHNARRDVGWRWWYEARTRRPPVASNVHHAPVTVFIVGGRPIPTWPRRSRPAPGRPGPVVAVPAPEAGHPNRASKWWPTRLFSERWRWRRINQESRRCCGWCLFDVIRWRGGFDIRRRGRRRGGCLDGYCGRRWNVHRRRWRRRRHYWWRQGFHVAGL
jgi:hypothetical protein